MSRLQLPTVTLCAVTSVNVPATVAAMQESMRHVDFGQCLLLADAEPKPIPSEIRVVPIQKIASGADYSDFLLRQLAQHIETEHCLIVQWDGFVLDASRWHGSFLKYDYIGAAWPQFRDGHDVGNGGFSLRSRKLLEACLDPDFEHAHPEDVAICRTNRNLLEETHGIRFADRATADRFAFERTGPAEPTFGFHGVFNMIRVLGGERFWEIYSALDDRKTAFVDYRKIMSQLGAAPGAAAKRTSLTLDRLRCAIMGTNA